MTRTQLLVSASVALICGAILVIFTDIEIGLVRWVNCGPLASARARQTPACR